MLQAQEIALLRHIYHWQPVTRRELSVRLGLSPARISALVGPLLTARLLSEEECPAARPGRPATALRLNPTAGIVAGLDVGGQETWGALVDFSGRVVHSRSQTSQTAMARDAILDTIAEMVRGLCRHAHVSPADLLGLGVGLQGIVDTHSGTVLGWPNTPAWAPAWTGVDVRAELAQRLGVSLIVVDDSVRAMATAARRLGMAGASDSFLYVHIGEGIGGALVTGGCAYRSATGIAAELGHVTAIEGGPSCSCGNRGCLEVVASAPALLRRAHERLQESWLVSSLREAQERGQLSLPVLLEAAGAGDKLAFQLLDEAGSLTGRVIATALNIVGVDLVILGGPLVRDGGIILDAVQRQVRLRALAPVSRQVRIAYDQQGDHAGAHEQAYRAFAPQALFASPARLQALTGK